jgi:type II secretory pathway component GspD/PulD (secretin)
VDTLIDVMNGQTIVIACLIVDKIIETNRSVPFLADIPVIGNFFKYVNQEKKKSELVIMLTPYILDDKNIEEIKIKEEENIKKLGRPFHQTP